MLFVGNQRGGGKDLAQHLMKDENDRVEVHEIRGFIGQDLEKAFKESYAISKATKCKKHLYSLSINPPPGKEASNADFENAIERVEQKLGLTDQPRAIVFHEKKGMDGQTRRYAHAVWCRINTDDMKAVQHSHDHPKLMDVSRDLFVELGWKMPRGMLNSKDRDPLNFSLAEWQQAKRAGRNARELKSTIKDCWAISDSKTSFAHALKEHGFILAKGRRGHVAVDYQGEAYAISRATDLKAKQVRNSLGEIDDLPSVAEAHKQAASLITDRLSQIKVDEAAKHTSTKQRLADSRERIRENQDVEKEKLKAEHTIRQHREEAERQARLRKGVMGFVDRLTGKRKKTLAHNKQEAAQSVLRDQSERDVVAARHRQNQEQLHKQAREASRKHETIRDELQTDIKTITQNAKAHKDEARESFKATRRSASQRPRRRSSRWRDGPSLGR